jgi:hypothetical protein
MRGIGAWAAEPVMTIDNFFEARPFDGEPQECRQVVVVNDQNHRLATPTPVKIY